MLRDFRRWLEVQASCAALVVVHVAGFYWCVIAMWKLVAGEPLVYGYRGSLSSETVPVLILSAVQLIALAYQSLKRSVLGPAEESALLHQVSPTIALCCGVALALWAAWRPAASASYVPLSFLLLVSVVCTGAARGRPLHGSASVAPGIESPRAEHAGESVCRWRRPTVTLADVHGYDALKQRLLEVAKPVLQRRSQRRNTPPRNGILLHGTPGNGKTFLAEALAGELGLPLLALSYSDVASKWVGEKTGRVRATFQQATANQPCVLFIDEVESFLEMRSGAAEVKEDRDLVNALLTLLVDIRPERVLLVAATNHPDRLDGAAVREGRFDFKIEVPPPDLAARVSLLRRGLRANAAGAQVPEELIASVARRLNGYSTKRILALTEEIPGQLRRSDRRSPDFADFMAALRSIQGRAGLRLENVLALDDLVLSTRTRAALSNIAARMVDPLRTERHGGSLPTGVIFHGPPGTGKTAAAKAVAKQVDWTFIMATGAELSRDFAALERICTKAADLRPSIIFIDEADELLLHRDMSLFPTATNKLLTLLDGAGDRVVDVVWIAATNHLDRMDPAVLRGGRFSEKVEFQLPSLAAMTSHIEVWLGGRGIILEPELDAARVAAILDGLSIADADAVIQAAVNLMIARNTPVTMVMRGDVLQAMALVKN